MRACGLLILQALSHLVPHPLAATDQTGVLGVYPSLFSAYNLVFPWQPAAAPGHRKPPSSLPEVEAEEVIICPDLDFRTAQD